MTFEKIEELFNEKTEIYFAKYFENKSPDEYLYKISCDALLTLGNTDAKFYVMLNCLERITNNTSYFNTLDLKTQNSINNTKIGIEEVCRCLEKIIDSIIEEATV